MYTIMIHILAYITVYLQMKTNHKATSISHGTTAADLRHLGRDKMAMIYQTTFSNAFWYIIMFEFGLKATEICSQGSIWQYFSTGSDNGLVSNRWQAIIWTIDVLGCPHLYASLSLNELIVILISQPCQCNSVYCPRDFTCSHGFPQLKSKPIR